MIVIISEIYIPVHSSAVCKPLPLSLGTVVTIIVHFRALGIIDFAFFFCINPLISDVRWKKWFYF